MADWLAEHNRWLTPYEEISGGIIEPTDVDEMIAEILESVPAYIWADVVAKEIRFRAVRPVDEQIIDLTDQAAILEDTQGRQVKMAEQVSRAEVYFNVVDLTEGLDKPRNFREARIGFGEQFGLPRVRQIFSRWLKSDVQATQTARTLLLASNRLPVYITAEVGIRHLDTIGPGSVVRLQTRILQDATGAEETTLFLVVEASENRNSTRLRLTMRTIGGFPAPSFYASDSIPSFASATVTEKEENAFWSDDGTLDGNPTPYVWS